MGSSANGVTRGQLRPYIGSRGPPFVICGLFVFLLIVGYSYWNLSFRFNVLNSDFVGLEEKLRASAIRNDQLVKQNEELSVSLQKTEAEVQRIKSSLSKKEDELLQTFNQLRSKEDEVGRLTSQVEALKPEVDKYKQGYDELTVIKDQLDAQIKELKEKNAALEEIINKNKKSDENKQPNDQNSLKKEPDSKVPAEPAAKVSNQPEVNAEAIAKKEEEQKPEVPLDPNVDMPKNIASQQGL